MIEITGLEALQRRLRRLDMTIRTTAVEASVKAGAEVIADAMRVRTPERVESASGTALRPGAMRRDIRVTETMDRDGFAVATIGPGKKTQHVALWVEYGHALTKGPRRRGHVVGNVAPHPFLRPAFEASQREAIEAFRRTMDEAIQKAVS